jgi:uncharacterized protein
VRAVLDPNVLVSAAISPAGPPRQILTAWTNERFELIASPALLDELANVLARPKLQRFITTVLAVAFIDGLATDATILTDPPEPPRVSPDPDDDYLIALARATAADYLVSGDRHLLDLTDPRPARPHPTPIPRPARHVTAQRPLASHTGCRSGCSPDTLCRPHCPITNSHPALQPTVRITSGSG